MSNTNLNKAKVAKNDEFYTRLEDIENELQYYEEQFKGKVIYCNCDNPEWSKFYTYFTDNFERLGIKKLLISYYKSNGDGDFRSPESIELLKEADIVVSNPPFSKFREYVAQLVEYDKQFLIIGNINAVTYKDTFKLIQNNKMWIGITRPTKFTTPDSEDVGVQGRWYTNIKNFGNTRWITNLGVRRFNKDLVLTKKYNPEDYPKYDNYNAINVDKIKDIPMDYYEPMGVPITFLDKYSPFDFEIVKFRKGDDMKDLSYTRAGERVHPFTRIVIKKKTLK